MTSDMRTGRIRLRSLNKIQLRRLIGLPFGKRLSALFPRVSFLFQNSNMSVLRPFKASDMFKFNNMYVLYERIHTAFT